MIDGMAGRRVLVVGAHADDIEIGCGGTVRRLLEAGAAVNGLVVTDTHYVRDEVVHRDAAVSRREAQAAAAVIGYTPHFGSVPNNDVDVTSDLVYFIRDYIERFEADTIFTHWDGDAHLDHRNVARATIMATRDPRNLLMYRSNFYASPETFRPTLLVDVSAHMAVKEQALACFAAELDRMGPGYFDWIRDANRLAGAMAGVAYAEAFEIVKFHT